MNDNVIDLFTAKKLDTSKGSSFDWQGYVNNVRTIQAGFSTLDAHRKCVAFQSVADAFCEVLTHIFDDKVVEEEIKGD